MPKSVKYIVVAALLFAIVGYVYFFSGIVFPWQEKAVAQTVQDWGGLAPLPENISNVSMSKSGGIFTTTYEVEFDADAATIEKWIQSSKRLNKNSPKLEEDNKLYKVYPGEKQAMGGTVKIQGTRVKIRMMWS